MHAKLKLIVADDESIIRMDIREMLEGVGHKVIGEARDGQTALELTKKLNPDLVIMDVKMPVMDGLKSAQLISRLKLAPVLLLTAYSDEMLITKAKDAHVCGYLIKPITEKDLLTAVEIAYTNSNEMMNLKIEVAKLKDYISSRKLIETAKGIVMLLHNLSEQQAYDYLREESKLKNCSMKAIAQQIIEQKK